MADRQSRPTRRRALGALAGAAVAIPAAAVAAGNTDAEIERLHDAIAATEATLKRLCDERAVEEERFYDLCPEWPDDAPAKVAAAAGLDRETYDHMTMGEFDFHFNGLSANAQQRVLDAEAARDAAYEWKRSEEKRIAAETGWDKRKEAIEKAENDGHARLRELRDVMAETPACTPRGVLLKLRAVIVMELGRETAEETGLEYSTPVIFSVIDDMERIAGGDHAA